MTSQFVVVNALACTGIGFAIVFTTATLVLSVLGVGTKSSTPFASIAFLIILLASLIWLFARVWISYVRARYRKRIRYTLFEIKLSDHIDHALLSMEAFFTALHALKGRTSFVARYWYGTVPPEWSFELSSFNGHVRYYIRTPADYEIITAGQLDAYFPGIQLIPAIDYTTHALDQTAMIRVFDYTFYKRYVTSLPIKTFRDIQELEQKTSDPIKQVISLMASVEDRTQVWLQFVIRAHDNGKKLRSWGFLGRSTRRLYGARVLIQKLLERTEDGIRSAAIFPRVSKLVVKSIERHVHKPQFECGIRVVYLGDNKTHNASLVANLQHLFEPFSRSPFNTLRVQQRMPWQRLLMPKRYNRKIIRAYHARGFFYAPYKLKTVKLSTEELAMVTHPPQQDVRVAYEPDQRLHTIAPHTKLPI